MRHGHHRDGRAPGRHRPGGRLAAPLWHGRLRVRVPDSDGAAAVLRAAGHAVAVEGDLLLVSDVGDPAQVTRALAAHHLYATEVAPASTDLESVYLAITSRGQQ